MLFKSLLRTIKKSLGRYLAIFAIIALGVGFFTGLRVSSDAMLETADEYVNDLNLFDLRLVSSVGFTDNDVEAFGEIEGVIGAYGSVSSTVLCAMDSGSDVSFNAHMLISGINEPEVLSGRLPQEDNECVIDAKYFDESHIGETIVLSKNNSDDTLGSFTYSKYVIVGIINSPYYINFERENASGFIYMNPGAFVYEEYTEIFIDAETEGEIYSDKYDNSVTEIKAAIEPVLEERAKDRFESLIAEKWEYVNTVQAQVDAARANLDPDAPDYAVMAAQIDKYQQEIDEGVLKLESQTGAVTYVLNRSSNVGYACLGNDTKIVVGISKVFPVFFFLVAALVCITTMTRMVDEQRTENGVLFALGYSKASIAGQYLFYAGSASVLGCFGGFLLGSKLMPMAIWEIYDGIMYSLNRSIKYVLDWKLFAVVTLCYLVCILGVTYLAARTSLNEAPAELIRPKTMKAGKRVLIERVTFFWKRLSFLHKVSVRNIFRYKKRMFMMILGIGGCTALLLTGFGIRDSIQPIVKYQFEEIDLYDISATFLHELSDEEFDEFEKLCGEGSNICCLSSESADVECSGGTDSATLLTYDNPPEGLIDIHNGDTKLSWPKTGEAVINYRLARDLSLNVGDTLDVRFGDNGEYAFTVTISGVFDNYIYNYILLDAVTLENNGIEVPEFTTAYVGLPEGTDVHDALSNILSGDFVVTASACADMKERVGTMLEGMNYVVLIVLVCAGALAFIVMYNLTNISITERMREIATLKVLGFYKNETASYVFRENIILTVIGSFVGIPLGIWLLNYVMDQIKIKSMYFGCHLEPTSYVYAIVLSIIFGAVSELFLLKKLDRIDMAESLKAIE